jgi:type I restriction enzyme, R subunit
MSNFAFLATDFPEVHSQAIAAENAGLADARVVCLYARRTLEAWVHWLYHNDSTFTRPYDNSLNGMMNTSSFEQQVPQAVRLLAHAVRRIGNTGVHDSKTISSLEAVGVLRDLWGVMHWFYATYKSSPTPPPSAFDETLLPPAPSVVVQKTLADIKTLEGTLEKLNLQNTQANAELEALRASVASRKAQNSRVVSQAPYSEAETRAKLIDQMLLDAGWDLTQANVQEFGTTAGRADYVLWGADGLPLAVVEAKKTSRDPAEGQKQAFDYAKALEAQFGQMPIIFYTNGIKTHLWDYARGFPPRLVQSFYNRDALELAIQRRRSATGLEEHSINTQIAGRSYQETAIRKFCERLTQKQRKGLLVMATGTGKTRVTVGLSELLMRAGWVKRVLFLADRNGLVRQAKKAFLQHYPASNPINLVEDKNSLGSRVVISTYQTMLRQLEAGAFNVGHFDLLVVDEAHRSVYAKYGAIFEYFDAMLLGLTATPKAEVDRNTYRLFDSHDNLPIFEYGLEEAVRDGYLVPPKAYKVKTQFLAHGIEYAALSDDDKAAFDEIEWDDYGGRREEIQNTELYQWLFNENTVDQVLQTLMLHGQKVHGTATLGKTIIFAQNTEHAKFIQKRFDFHYPHLAGSYAQVIAHKIERADDLLEQFTETPLPRIAISVDMLDTGVDVPEVVNLVFFRRVQSKTKFWQMIGRGTRLCENLLEFGAAKQEFLVFDFCGNLEFFDVHPKGIEGKPSEPLEQRRLKLQLELLRALEPLPDQSALHNIHANALHEWLCAIPENNFLVRPHLLLLEKFSKREAWNRLALLDYKDLRDHVCGLPSAITDPDEAAKRFDLLMWQATLGLLESVPRTGVQKRIAGLCAELEKKHHLVQVKNVLPLIQSVCQPEFWQTASPTDLEQLRQTLRGLMVLIDQTERRARLETDFADTFFAPEATEILHHANQIDREAYQKKVQGFLLSHLNHPIIQKIRQAQPLTQSDLHTLEEFLFSARALESRATFEWAYGQEANLGRFVRRLVGLDRMAAKRAFSQYLDGKSFSSDQIQFVEYIVDALTANGTVEKTALFESPFIDLHSLGLNGLFMPTQAKDILSTLEGINSFEPPSASA